MNKINFVKIDEKDLKKSDKRGLATLYLYYLSNGKLDTFDLPLFIDDNGKGVLSVEVFKRVFYAFQLKVENQFNADVVSGDDGNDGKYSIVRISKLSKNVSTHFDDYEQPKTKDIKRESSKITKQKSEAKKVTLEEIAKKELDEQNAKYNKAVIIKITDLLQSKYKMKFNNLELSALETELNNILNTTK